MQGTAPTEPLPIIRLRCWPVSSAALAVELGACALTSWLFWEPNAFAMRSNYENPEVTERLNAAKFLSPADPARAELYHEVQALMLADAPAVWLAEPHHIVASSQDVLGFIWRPDQINRYYYVTKSV